MRTIEKTVLNPSGIHLRPAALFVKAAAAFSSRITLENLTLGKAPQDAKSMIGVMTAGSRQGHTVRITAEGPDEEAAIAALEAAIDSGLGEAIPG
jgi:phosphotransferase system HPr (HPr) family protein